MKSKINKNFKVLPGQITSTINTVKFIVYDFFQFNNDLANDFLMIVLLNVYICPLRKKSEEGESFWGHRKMYTPGTKANSQTD